MQVLLNSHQIAFQLNFEPKKSVRQTVRCTCWSDGSDNDAFFLDLNTNGPKRTICIADLRGPAGDGREGDEGKVRTPFNVFNIDMTDI
jgi:hypothetical protein